MGGRGISAVGAALSAFSGDVQHNRLMRLVFPFDDGPPAALLPNSLSAYEEVSRGFRFVVEVISDDARIPLKMLMGRMATVSLVRQDGTLRYFNGYITEFRLLRADGGFAYYQMVLEPWLAFTRLRKNCVSFQNKSVREITEETLEHYRQADWHMHVFEEDPRITLANQYNETDYNHLHRRWEARGMHYWYEHRFDGHKLIISDKSLLAEPIDATRMEAPDVIPFCDENGSREDDGIHEWTAVRRIGSGKTTLASFDYKNPADQTASVDSGNSQGDIFPYEIYEDTGAYGFRMRSDGEQSAKQRMEEQDKETQYFDAAGNDRSLLPGRTFKLGDHFSAEPRSQEYDTEPRRGIGDRDYLILTVEHRAANNYQAGPSGTSHYENRFTCIRKDIRWRPGRQYNSEPGSYTGLHTATVVGPPGSEIHTDRYGRVKLQFHWDRLNTYDENSSPWIRVMTPAAGNEFGQIRLPRVGEEVAVVYPNGNVDHPLVLGALYNERHMPPWKLPEQAALTGLRSCELAAGGKRGNHLVLDDTAGEIQAQLKSDHLYSQLSLGYITRIENIRGRMDARGEGWELRTDGHGIARAAEGMLLTTERRTNAQSHMKDMGETIQRFKDACDLHESLSLQALHSQAQEKGQQDEVTDRLQEQSAAIVGGGDKFPELAEPHLVLSSPAGIGTSTAQSTHISSDHHTALTTGRSLSIATGESLFASIKNTFRLFVHKAGMKLVAAGGKVTIQAQQDEVEVIARKVMSLISQTDWIDLKGKKGIRLHGADSMLEISDVVQFFTSKPVLFRGNLETLPSSGRAHPNYSSPSSDMPPRSARGKFDERFRLVSEDGETPLAHRRYRITAEDGQSWEGTTSSEGLTERVYTVSEQKLSVEII